MRKFLARIFATLRNVEWISSLVQYLTESDWVASLVQRGKDIIPYIWGWGAAAMIGLSTAGLIAGIQALNWSLVTQWVVGIGWIPLCGFIAYKANKRWEPMEIKPEDVAREPDTGPATIPGTQQAHRKATDLAVSSPGPPPSDRDTDSSGSASNVSLMSFFRALRLLNRGPVPSLPGPEEWVGRNVALRTLENSSLVQLKLPPSSSGHYSISLIDELSRHLLLSFEQEYPEGVRNGEYRLDLLNWWIDKTAYHR